MKLRKKLTKNIFMLSICCILSICSIPFSCQAAGISSSHSKNYVFTVPDGGLSNVDINLTYREKFTVSGNNNTFNDRTKSWVYNMTYATVKPSIWVGNAVHYDENGKSKSTFSSWNKISMVYDSTKWKYGSMYENTESKTYSKTTAYTAKLAFQISVKGALVPIKYGTITLKLATG